MIAILVSTKDLAGMNMRKQLLEVCSFEPLQFSWQNHPVYEVTLGDNQIRLYTTDENLVYISDDILDSIETNMIISCTKHDAKSGIPSLSCHAPGNWSSADLGGVPERVGVALPRLMAECFTQMKVAVQEGNHDLDVVYEATHHGPSYDVPIMFIEIGSTEKEWIIEEYGTIIANTLKKVLTEFTEHELQQSTLPVAVGIGGLHTCPRFGSRVSKKEFVLGHVCPHYQLANLTVEKVKDAMKRCVPAANVVAVDWKGLKKEKDTVVAILEVLESEGIVIKKIK